MNTRKITKVIIGVVVIGSATGYLLYQAIGTSFAYCYPVDEFVESTFFKTSQNTNGRTSRVERDVVVRLAGRVKAGSVTRNAEAMQLDFELAGEKNSVPVRFNGIVPKNFEAEKEVFVEGKVGDNGVFQAWRILTRCESKYKVKLNEKLKVE